MSTLSATYQQKLRPLLTLVRTGNLMLLIVVQTLTYFFLLDNLPHLPHLDFLAILMSTVCLAGAGYAINDYYDVKIDALNKPDRVIVGRQITRRKVLFLHYLLNLLGMGLALSVSVKVMLLVSVSGISLWVYSAYLKQRPFIGNFMVAGLSALAVGIFALHFEVKTSLYWFAGFAFILSLIRELVKDMEDLKGDLKGGCKTLPIVWGYRKTKTLCYVLWTVLAGFSVYWLSQVTFYGAIWSMLTIIPLQLLFAVKLYYADRSKHFKFLSLLCKLTMLAGTLSIIH